MGYIIHCKGDEYLLYWDGSNVKQTEKKLFCVVYAVIYQYDNYWFVPFEISEYSHEGLININEVSCYSLYPKPILQLVDIDDSKQAHLDYARHITKFIIDNEKEEAAKKLYEEWVERQE